MLFDLDDGFFMRSVPFTWDTCRMGRAIRDFDWRTTSLGPIDAWPVALHTAVRMMMGQQHAHCLFWGPDLVMIYNDAYAPMLGKREGLSLGGRFRDVWSDVWADVSPLVRQALSGQGTYSEEMRLIMTRNGFDEETFFTFSYSPLYDDHGKVAGLLCVTVDVTATVIARRNQQIMQRELVHRIKNILSVTSTVVSSSLRNAVTLEQARDTVAARIMALARAQGLVTELGETADIAIVVQRALEAYRDGSGRFSISGPPVPLTPQQAVGLSLALYELATNAAKYGALSDDGGRVGIAWDLTGEGDFTFGWSETGGPVVIPPDHEGFGSSLTNLIAPSYFDGMGQTEFAALGLCYTLTGRIRG